MHPELLDVVYCDAVIPARVAANNGPGDEKGRRPRRGVGHWDV
jgi:hypothetical protein